MNSAMRCAPRRALSSRAPRVGVNPPRGDRGNAPLRAPNTHAGEWATTSSKQPVDVDVHLPLPVWPIVAAFGAPVVQMVRDTAGPEDLGEPVGRAAVFVRPTPGREVEIALTEEGEAVGIAQVGHV